MVRLRLVAFHVLVIAKSWWVVIVASIAIAPVSEHASFTTLSVASSRLAIL